MSKLVKTNIAWADYTWNPWQGCHKVSEACKNCYMFRDKERFGQDPNVVVRSKPSTFNKPYKIPDGSWVFTCSWSDFFIKEADDWRADAWKVIRETPKLKYLVLTKRIDRFWDSIHGVPDDWGKENYGHVWLGVTAGNQDEANKAIPLLLKIKAVSPWLKVFVSVEPMIGKVDLTKIIYKPSVPDYLQGEDITIQIDALTGNFDDGIDSGVSTKLDWVIVGVRVDQKPDLPILIG